MPKIQSIFKRQTKILIIVAGILILATFMLSGIALAAEGDPCGPSDPPQSGLICGNCTSQGCVWTTNTNGVQSNGGVTSNPIYKDLNMLVNFVSAGVGILVVGTIILGGIQYTMAGDSPDAIGKAKARIMNGLIALAAFLFIFSFVQWLIPGGVF